MPPSCVAPGESPLDASIRRETERRVRTVVARLPRMMGRVLLLRYWRDMNSEQIARKLGIRVKAVDRLAWRGRKRMKNMLAV